MEWLLRKKRVDSHLRGKQRRTREAGATLATEHIRPKTCIPERQSGSHFIDRVRVVSLLASPRRLDASSAWVAHEDQGEAAKEADLASIDNLLQLPFLYDCALDMRIVESDVDWKSAALVAQD